MTTLKWILLTISFLSLSLNSITAQEDINRYSEVIWNPVDDTIAVITSPYLSIYDTSFNLIEQVNLNVEFAANLSWSPQGDTIAFNVFDPRYSHFNQGIQLWDINPLQLRAEINGAATEAGIAWHPNDGRIAASYTIDRLTSEIRIYNALDGSLSSQFAQQSGDISALAWRPDGNQITFPPLGKLQFWNPNTGQPEGIFEDIVYTGRLTMEYSPTGDFLAFVHNNANEVHIWNTNTLQKVDSVLIHPDRVGSLNWGSGGLITVSTDGYTRLWDTNTFQPIASYLTGFSLRPSWSPDGSQFVAGTFGNGAVIRDTATGDIVASTDSLPRLESIILVNGDTGDEITINDGDTINLSTIGTNNFDLRFDTTPATVGYVHVNIDQEERQIISSPYIINDINLGAGTHMVQAIPFIDEGLFGVAGYVQSIEFTIEIEAP